MNEEEKKAIKYYQDKEISFSCDFNTEELLKALGIEETEKDSFENHQIRFRTLLNLIEKQDKIINKMAEQLTTPIHSKEWVIDYYKKEIEK